MDYEFNTDEQLRDFRDKMNEDKGFNAKPIITGKRHFLKAINFLLITAFFQQPPKDLNDMIVGMKLFLDRFCLAEDCYIVVDPESYKPHFVLAEDINEF